MLKRSVTSSLAHMLFAIVLLAVICSLLALLSLSASLRDAEAINIAGSLRMQSYRLAWDASTDSGGLAANIASYNHSIKAPVLLSLHRAWVPASVRDGYQKLVLSWQKLQPALEAGNTLQYQQNISGYVAQIDRFVLALQHWAEQKMEMVFGACLLGFVAIAMLVICTLRKVTREVVKPLNQLVTASQAIEQKNFHHAPLATTLPNELGVLAQAFTHMSAELEKHYYHLEQTVKEKTSDLRQANRRLALLYKCSEMLHSNPDSGSDYSQVLEQALEHENLLAIALNAPPRWQLIAGEPHEELSWHSLPLDAVSGERGLLRWQAQHSEPQLMQGLATMLARSLQLDSAEQQVRHLLLMEERATMARELHDSLAQSLVYLRIQLARLKRLVESDSAPGAIVGEIDLALAEANRQLRELLTTFRLSVEPADLTTALGQVTAQLRLQTEADIQLTGEFLQQHLAAQQQVHVLQIVREALLNAIRHASATKIVMHGSQTKGKEIRIEIKDNGRGFNQSNTPPGHYGLAIMQERAKSLNGQLEIVQAKTGGTQVILRFPSG